MKDEFRAYRIWFYAAAAYNAVWGAAVIVFPRDSMRLVGLNVPDALPLIQVVGMIVGVYGYGYFLLARDPKRYCGLIWIGLAGKVFGPVGFLQAAIVGTLPWSFGWVCVFNDLIWWPVFISFAIKHARRPLQ